MSEKRFVLDKLEKGNAILSVRITDSVTDDNYFIMTKEVYEDDIDEIVDKLNELYKENEQLRQQVQNAKEVAVENDVQYQICRKEKEDFQNMCEQLRKELGDCEKFRYTVFKRLNDEYIKECSIK